jgi:hypothetical protein
MSAPAEPEGPVFASPTPPDAVPDLTNVALPTAGSAAAAHPGIDDAAATDRRLAPIPSATEADGPDRFVGMEGADVDLLRSPRHADVDDDPVRSAGSERSARGRDRRRLLLVIGSVVAVALLAVGTSLGVARLRERGWEPLDADLAAPTRAHAVQLVLGSCLAALPEGERLDRVRVVPCGDPHTAQVVGRTDAEPEAVWPGEHHLVARAARVCGPALLEGDPPAGLTFSLLTPSHHGWEAGDRTSLCLAQLAASSKGSLIG